ncbi:MAG: ankyrin repeat domain-containing protein, partial [Ectothiorhodospiraceae bacterium AqS1]|nr:ankyrin repeat domain-containing protein [Ectothiorhodospiraceae bacterium AqS1]
TIDILIDAGADLTAKVDNRWTPMKIAIQNKRWAAADFLMKALGAKMPLSPLDGQTPLHLAAEAGNTAFVKSLLDAGEDPNAPNKNQSTPLHLAAWRGHIDTIKALINSGADPSARNEYDWTPLHSASLNGCVDTIDILIDAGADLTAKVDNRWTPMKIAIQNKR